MDALFHENKASMDALFRLKDRISLKKLFFANFELIDFRILPFEIYFGVVSLKRNVYLF